LLAHDGAQLALGVAFALTVIAASVMSLLLRWRLQEGRVAHRLIRTNCERDFELRIDLGAGLGEHCRGGVTRPLHVIGAWSAF
jgi:hypothetical protein